MSGLLENFQYFDMIAPYTGLEPFGPVAKIEIQPVKHVGGHCEPCESGKEDFWSVYIRYDPGKCNDFGGVDCVADCASYDGAVKLADLLAALLGVEVVQRCSHEHNPWLCRLLLSSTVPR